MQINSQNNNEDACSVIAWNNEDTCSTVNCNNGRGFQPVGFQEIRRLEQS